jgi:hypothetical protein
MCGENLSSNVNPSPRPPMLGWLGDFDNETEDLDDIMRSVRAKDRHPLKVYPVYAAVGLHDAELTRFVLGAVRPERLGRARRLHPNWGTRSTAAICVRG